jgi:hypothetical protein
VGSGCGRGDGPLGSIIGLKQRREGVEKTLGASGSGGGPRWVRWVERH